MFRWRPSECRECCCWFSLNSATFHFSEVCRHRVHAQDLGDTGYVLHITECCFETSWDSWCCKSWSGLMSLGGSKGRYSVCVLPPASRCMHAWVHMSVCDLPVHVDVSITPGCCWCSLLLFEVSAAAADCLAFWCCECWGKKTTWPCSRAQIRLIYADVCLILNLVCIRGPFDAACFALSCHFKGNKGGVSARMTMFGHPVCFLNCHLPAHMRNLEQRMEDFESILQQQQFEGGAATGVLDHEWVTFLFFLFLFLNKRSN